MSVHSILRGALAALALCVALDASAAVGLIQFVAGDVKIRNAAGQVRAAAKGGSVDEGDTLLTAASSSAQLKMADGGIVAVRPETELKVDTFRYSGKEDGTERAIMSLAKGGFRTITGLIGRTNKQNYTINTPTATIGIRGTDHEPVVIPVPPVGAPGLPPGAPPGPPPGTYDKVNVGAAFIRSPLGEVNIRQNQVGYASPNQAPQLLPKVPEFFKATPPVKQAQATQKEDQQKQGEQKQADQKQQSGTSGQSSSGDKPAEGQSTQTASSGTSSDSGSGTSSTSGSTTGEMRSSATVDATPVTASTGSTATTTAVVPTTPTVVAPVTTTSTQPPAVVQEVKGTSGDSSLTLNLTSQTTTTSSGTTTTISESTTVNPTVSASTYGSLLVSQAPVSGTTTELEGLTFQPQAQTSYVFNTAKALTEVRHTGHATTDAQGLARSIDDANLKLAGGTAADVFADDTSTFYIGRQQGGTITITDNSGANAPITQSLDASSLHWLVGVQPALTGLPGGVGTVSVVQNMTGFAHYSLSHATHATHPTDRAGNIGTLTDALIFANFDSQTIFGSLGLKFSTAAGEPKSTRDLELLAIASNVPIKRGGFEAIAGTSTAPFVFCSSGDCVERSYRGTIRGLFGAASGNTNAVGNGLGLSYSFGPENPQGTQFDDLIQGTAVLTNTEAAPTAGTQLSFANNSNVRHDVFYGTLQTASSDNANLAIARDTLTLASGAQLAGPRTNANYLFDASGNLVRIYNTPYAVFDHGTSQSATGTFTAPTPLANAQVSFGGIEATAEDLFDDSALGLRMGRWKGGVINVTDLATGNGYVEELGDRSVHWLVRSAPTSLPVTGVYQYTRVAATQPTDTYGNVGTLDRARLQVDFGRSTVSAGVAITMPTAFGGAQTQSLSGYFADVPLSSNGFNVSSNSTDNPANTDRLHVNCFGGGCAANQTYGGRIRGGFSTGTTASAADGAFLRYTFVTNYASQADAVAEGRVFDDYIDGFVAFKQGSEIVKPSFDISATGASAPIKPAGDATIVYAYNYLATVNSISVLNSRAEHLYVDGGNYEVDANGGLISATGSSFDDDKSVAGANPSGSDVQKKSVTSGTDPFEIAYGYYKTPTLTVKENGSTTPVTRSVDDTFQWIRGPAVYPFYLSMITENPANMSSSVKTVGYAYLGGLVTNAAGVPGTIDGSFTKLGVNFNAQTVDAQVRASVPFGSGNAIFQAVANRVALEDLGGFWASQNGPRQHNFSGGTGSGLNVSVNGGTATPVQGNIQGTLMGSGLRGAGFVFDFFDPSNSGLRASGSVAFGNPTYTDTSNASVAFQPSVLSDYRLGMVASGMNKTGSFISAFNSTTLEEQNNYRVDLGVLPPARAQFEGQDFSGTILPVLTRFDGVYPFGHNCNGGVCSSVTEIGARYSIDTASSATSSAKVLEAGYDASTGMRWGRWGGGMITVGERASGGTGPVPTVDGASVNATTVDATANHWHYLLTGVQSGPVVLPISGTFTYTLIGATSPTAYTPSQSIPDVGTLNTASLVANFTNKTVDVAVNLSTPGSGTWAASANAVKILKDTGFSVEKTLAGAGNLTVSRTVNNVTTTNNTAGQIVGGFAGQAGQGAGIAYSLNQGGASGTTVSGVAAFKR